MLKVVVISWISVNGPHAANILECSSMGMDYDKKKTLVCPSIKLEVLENSAR